MKQTLFADTWDELVRLMIGYYHDHCYHYYNGKTNEVPSKYSDLITENKDYVFIYEEAKPNKIQFVGI